MQKNPIIDRQLIRDPDMVHTDMDGETVMMSIEQGEYFGLSGVGPYLWERLEQPVTVDELCAGVVAAYDVDEAVCRKDVTGFVDQLLEQRIIRYVD